MVQVLAIIFLMILVLDKPIGMKMDKIMSIIYLHKLYARALCDTRSFI